MRTTSTATLHLRARSALHIRAVAALVVALCISLLGLGLATAAPAQAVPDPGAPIPSSSPSWTWQAPTWGGDSISQVSFVDDGHGWAVGTFRGVRHTTDGGLTWAVDQFGPPLGAMGVHFVDDQHGWIVGQGSDSYDYDGDWQFIYATSDGGGSWESQLVEFDPNHRAGLACVWMDDDSLHGWAAGRACQIYRTTDGGREWVPVDNIPLEEWAKPAFGFTAMKWLSDQVGFLLGTDLAGDQFIVVSTRDGGESWTVNLLPYEVDGRRVQPIWNLFFLDEDHGYVSGWGNWVLYTDDGGETWVDRSVPPTPDTFDIRGMHFDDTHHGWAVCSNGLIVSTTDGGLNWDLYDSETPVTLRTMTRLDGNTLLAMGDIGFGLHSDDNGATWEPVAEGLWLGGVAGSDWGSDACFTGTDSGWVCGPAGKLYHSTDDGRTWTRVPLGDDVDANLTRVLFVDRLAGWVADDAGVVHRTVDGGNTWQHVDTGSGQPIRDLFFFNGMRGWAVGHEATLLCTEDGGVTWQQRDPGVDGDLLTLFFVDEDHGWAAGAHVVEPVEDTEEGLLGAEEPGSHSAARRGSYVPRPQGGQLLQPTAEEPGAHPRLVRTTDGGATWTECQFGELGYGQVYDVHFLDPLNGWAAGIDSEGLGGHEGLFRTTDGGLTWEYQWLFPYPPQLLRTVHFTSPTDGIAMGGFGLTYATDDGGATWHLCMRACIDDAVDSLSFLDDQTGYAVTSMGAVLKTTVGGHQTPYQVFHLDGAASPGNTIVNITNLDSAWPHAVIVFGLDDNGRLVTHPWLGVVSGATVDVGPHETASFNLAGLFPNCMEALHTLYVATGEETPLDDIINVSIERSWSDIDATVLKPYGLVEDDLWNVSTGYPEGLWWPYLDMPRRQFVKMAVLAYGITPKYPATPTFVDVPATHEFYGYIEAAVSAGLIKGVGNDRFDPDGLITREQAAAIIARHKAGQEGVDLPSRYSATGAAAVLSPFTDAAAVSPALRSEIAYAVERDILRGDAGLLAPQGTLIRIQGAALLVRSMP